MSKPEYIPPSDLYAVWVDVFREGKRLQTRYQYYQFKHSLQTALSRMTLARELNLPDKEVPLAIWHLELSEEFSGWVPYEFKVEVTIGPDPKGPV